MIGLSQLSPTGETQSLTAAPVAHIGDWAVRLSLPDQVDVAIRQDYNIRIGKGAMAVVIDNLQTGYSTRIDRSLNVDINSDGITDYRFWGALTFQLLSGEKITIHTQEAGPSASNQRLVRQVSLTGPQAGMLVSNIDATDAQLIDMKLSANSLEIDRALRDNFIIYEAPNGGWVREKHVVTQNILSATAIGEYYGSGNNTLSFGQMATRIISSLLANIYTTVFHITGFDCHICRNDEPDNDPTPDKLPPWILMLLAEALGE